MNLRLPRPFLAAVLGFAAFAAGCGAADPVELAEEEPTEIEQPAAANTPAEAADPTDETDPVDDEIDQELDGDVELIDGEPAGQAPSSEGGEAGCERTYEIVAAAPRTAPSPLLTLGIENGFFAENCLIVTVQEGLTSRETITGVAANVINLGIVGLLPTTSAFANNDAPIEILAVVDAAAAPANDFVVLVAAAESEVTSIADLAETRVGIRSPNSLCAVALQQAMIGAGIDLDTVKFERGTSGELRQLLKRNRIDATCENYPGVDRLVEEGGIVFAGITEVFNIDVPYSVIASNSQWVELNPMVVQHFKDAMLQTAAWANEDEARFRAALPAASRLSAEQAGATILPFQVGAAEPTDFDFEPIFAALRATGVIDDDANLTSLFG